MFCCKEKEKEKQPYSRKLSLICKKGNPWSIWENKRTFYSIEIIKKEMGGGDSKE